MEPHISVEVMNQIVTIHNLLTNEVYKVPGVSAQAVFDDGGDGCVIIDDGKNEGDIFVFLEDVSKKVVVQDSQGQLYLKYRGNNQHSPVPLILEKSRFRDGDVKIPAEMSAASFAWNVFVFFNHRNGAFRFYWALPAMYEFMTMTVYGNNASSWVSRTSKALEKQFEEQCGTTQICRSTVITGKNAKKAQIEFEDRCLPVAAVSTWGLVLMLDGMVSKTAAAVELDPLAHAFLHRVIRTACLQRGDEQSLYFTVDFSGPWKPRWRLPELPLDATRGQFEVVGSDGAVCMNFLFNTDKNPLCVRIADILKGLVDDNNTIPIAQLLVALRAHPQAEPLIVQVIYAISRRLERVLGSKDVQKPVGRPRDYMDFSFNDSKIDDANPSRQSYVCAAYVYYCKTRFGSPLDTGIVTDKGNAHGLPLHASQFSWPFNFSAQAPAMVLCRKAKMVNKISQIPIKFVF